jgi:hypothetical protein
MLKSSAFNAQGSRVIIAVVHVGAVKIYVATTRSRESKDRMKLSLLPKLVEKLVWVPFILLCENFNPSHTFDALLCRDWPFSPRNRQTLRRTLLSN